MRPGDDSDGEVDDNELICVVIVFLNLLRRLSDNRSVFVLGLR